MSRRSSLKLNGNSFPIPLSLKKKLFYEECTIDERLRAIREARPGSIIYKKDLVPDKAKMSVVSRMASDFARSQFDNNLVGQLREDSFPDSKQVNREIISRVLSNEQTALQFREETSEQNLLINLKKQKYG